MTKMKSANGFVVEGMAIKDKIIDIRYTKDELGETLSLSDGKYLIGVDAKAIHKLLAK